MVQNNVNQFVSTVKSWSKEKQQTAIYVVESVRNCFSLDECLAEIKQDENGQEIVTKGTLVGAELAKLQTALQAL